MLLVEAVNQMCSVKNVFLEISQIGLRPATLLKKTLAQVFSWKFCKISKNTFSYIKPPVAASVLEPQLNCNSKVLIYLLLEKQLLVKQSFTTWTAGLRLGSQVSD